MIVDMTLPELGENITMGVVVRILVDLGGVVEAEQPIIEIETDKAVVEVPSEVSGVITTIHVAEGDEIKVGQLIVSIDVEKAAVSVVDEPDREEEPQSTISTQSAPVQTSTTSKTSEKEQDKISKSNRQLQPPDTTEEVAPAAPSVRRFAREIGVNIHAVEGSGPGGRISIEDIKNYARLHQRPEDSFHGGATDTESESLPDFTKWGEIERTPMSMVRKKTASHLAHAWATVPQVTQFDQADMSGMERFRKGYGDKVLAAGGKLTVTAILMKIVAGAMKIFPRINASVDMKNKEIIYKKYVNIGVAVDTKRGLLVPVVQNVDQLDLIDISVLLSHLAEKARTGKLAINDMQGGNFTISNLGGIGGTAFTPIVNAPEVAILGVSRSFHQPSLSGDRLESRLMLPLSLSYDHRIIDGAEGARFLRWIVEAIEQPLLLLLKG